MNTQILIDAIVRQTTVLIAQLATIGGARTPLADVAGQVFTDLARELQRQGVSRKVAADMFGLADDEEIVRGVLRDLVENSLVFRMGRGPETSYRAATTSELDQARAGASDPEGMDTLVWAALYRRGPSASEELAKHLNLSGTALDASLSRLVDAGRVVRTQAGARVHYRAPAFVVPLGESHGWEAAAFDHFQAVVTTLCTKLAGDTGVARASDQVGGSTYTLEVWPGHPFEEEALGELGRFRAAVGSLRQRVADYNRGSVAPDQRTRVVIYGGQCVTRHEEADDEDI